MHSSSREETAAVLDALEEAYALAGLLTSGIVKIFVLVIRFAV
jgi:hypothetical protein